jgi:cell division protein FtsB
MKMKRRISRGKTGGKKRFLLFFAILIAAITAFAIFGDKGLIDVWRFKQERDEIVSQNASLEQENKRLSEEIRLLETDKRYIATIARRELGMVGGDEVLYKIEGE